MAGAYRHTKRVKGSILTKAIYDADHENHITYGEAQYLNGISLSLAQLQTIASPGGVGSEVVPDTVAAYLQQLRYVLKNTTNATYWYQKTVTKTSSVVLYPDDAGLTLVSFGFDGTRIVRYVGFWPVTNDYAGGNVEVRFWVANSSGSGDVYYTKAYGELASGENWSGATASTQTITRSDLNSHAVLMNVPEEDIPASGSALVFSLLRDPTNAADTSPGHEYLWGATVTYNAYVGR